MTTFRRTWCFSILAVLAGSGCLGAQYEVSRAELERLAHEDPQYRGEDVRVHQAYAGQEHEPPPGEHRSRRGGSTYVYIGGSAEVRAGGGGSRGRGSARAPEPRGEPRVRDHRGGDDGDVRTRDHRGGDDGDVRTRDHRDSDERSKTRTESDSGGSTSTDAADSADSARRILIAAAVVGGALALTRGLKYEGWVDVDPAQPVHLIGPRGEYDWVPLSEITPEDAQFARKAYISPRDGAIRRRGRAPLHRRGWTYSMLLGGGQIPLIGASPKSGFVGRFDIGYFLIPAVGLGADVAFGWTDDANGDTVFDSRLAAQLEFFPVRAGRFHAGLFGQLGGAARADDGVDGQSSSALMGAGGLLQLDLTTNLALTGRLGVTRVYGDALLDAGVGISVY